MTKRRTGPDEYLSARDVAELLGVTPSILRVWHQRYPQMPQPDAVVGPLGARGSMYGYLPATVEDIRVWKTTRRGEGAPGRPKPKAHRDAISAALTARNAKAREG